MMTLTQKFISNLLCIFVVLLISYSTIGQTHINTSKGRIESVDENGTTIETIIEFETDYFLGITDEYMMIEPMDQSEKIDFIDDHYFIDKQSISKDTSYFSFKALSIGARSNVRCHIQNDEVKIETKDAQGSPVRIIFYIDDLFTD